MDSIRLPDADDHSDHWHTQLPEGVVPYLVILFNTVIFFTTRKFINRFVSIKYRLFLDELISTIELCADCSELGKKIESDETTIVQLCLHPKLKSCLVLLVGSHHLDNGLFLKWAHNYRFGVKV
jgi:hypothetical protein